MSEKLLHVEIEKIQVNPYQPRKYFSKDELKELADSIESVGLIHPPVVRPIHDGFFELISGERRFRAMCLAGFKSIPVVVRSVNHSLSAQAALIENVQRVDLNSIEIAQALHSLMVEFGLNQEDLSQRVGKKRSTVANYLRLLTLPKHIQEAVLKEKISMGHAKAILGLETLHHQNLLYDLILSNDLNVRLAEAQATRIKENKKPQKKKFTSAQEKSIFLDELEKQFQEKLGTKVSIRGKGNKGQISIDYYNLDDLDRILNILSIVESNNL